MASMKLPITQYFQWPIAKRPLETGSKSEHTESNVGRVIGQRQNRKSNKEIMDIVHD
jgi:hypothetical protein